MSTRANIGSIKQHCAAPDSRSATNPHAIHPQHPILKTMSLELTAHRSPILKLQHIRIHDLRETSTKHYSTADLYAHSSQVPRQNQSAFQHRKRMAAIKPPRNV